MYHFVLDEDIVPAVLFYKHAFEKIPKPSMASRAIGYDKMNVLLTVLNQALGVALESLPPEAQTLDKLSMYEQPVYDQCPEGAMEPYAPAGNWRATDREFLPNLQIPIICRTDMPDIGILQIICP